MRAGGREGLLGHALEPVLRFLLLFLLLLLSPPPSLTSFPLASFCLPWSDQIFSTTWHFCFTIGQKSVEPAGWLYFKLPKTWVKINLPLSCFSEYHSDRKTTNTITVAFQMCLFICLFVLARLEIKPRDLRMWDKLLSLIYTLSSETFFVLCCFSFFKKNEKERESNISALCYFCFVHSKGTRKH